MHVTKIHFEGKVFSLWASQVSTSNVNNSKFIFGINHIYAQSRVIVMTFNDFLYPKLAIFH